MCLIIKFIEDVFYAKIIVSLISQKIVCPNLATELLGRKYIISNSNKLSYTAIKIRENIICIFVPNLKCIFSKGF